MLCSPTMQKGLVNNAFQTSAVFCLIIFILEGTALLLHVRVQFWTLLCTSVLCLENYLLHGNGFLFLREEDFVFCSLDLADIVLTDLKSGRMIDKFWD